MKRHEIETKEHAMIISRENDNEKNEEAARNQCRRDPRAES